MTAHDHARNVARWQRSKTTRETAKSERGAKALTIVGRAGTKKAPQRGRPWTKDEDNHLLMRWGIASPNTIAKQLGRTRIGVIQRARALDLGPPTRGTLTMNEAARRSGHDVTRLMRVAEHLGITIGRARSANQTYAHRNVDTGRCYALEIEQYQAILAFLADKSDKRVELKPRARKLVPAWGGPKKGGGVWPSMCAACLSTDRPPYCRDTCKRCYMREWARAAWFKSRAA